MFSQTPDFIYFNVFKYVSIHTTEVTFILIFFKTLLHLLLLLWATHRHWMQNEKLMYLSNFMPTRLLKSKYGQIILYILNMQNSLKIFPSKCVSHEFCEFFNISSTLFMSSPMPATSLRIMLKFL